MGEENTGAKAQKVGIDKYLSDLEKIENGIEEMRKSLLETQGSILNIIAQYNTLPHRYEKMIEKSTTYYDDDKDRVIHYRPAVMADGLKKMTSLVVEMAKTRDSFINLAKKFNEMRYPIMGIRKAITNRMGGDTLVLPTYDRESVVNNKTYELSNEGFLEVLADLERTRNYLSTMDIATKAISKAPGLLGSINNKADKLAERIKLTRNDKDSPELKAAQARAKVLKANKQEVNNRCGMLYKASSNALHTCLMRVLGKLEMLLEATNKADMHDVAKSECATISNVLDNINNIYNKIRG